MNTYNNSNSVSKRFTATVYLNLLETTPMNRSAVLVLKCRYLKNKNCKTGKEKYEVKTGLYDLSLGLFSGASLLFILVKDDLQTALQTVELLLHDR